MEEFKVKKDCFGYCQEKNGCAVLDKLYCKKEDCGFYKTREQFRKDKAKYFSPRYGN